MYVYGKVVYARRVWKETGNKLSTTNNSRREMMVKSFPPVFKSYSCIVQPFIEVLLQRIILEALVKMIITDAVFHEAELPFSWCNPSPFSRLAAVKSCDRCSCNSTFRELHFCCEELVYRAAELSWIG